MVIHTEESGYGNTYRRASDLLDSSPNLEVHVLKIRATWSTEDKDMHAFESILRVLRSIQFLIISNDGFSTWSKATPGLTSAIFDIISLASPNRLHLLNMAHLPSSLIYHAVSSVRELALDAYVADSDLYTTTIVTKLAPLQPQLEHLILSHRCALHLSHLISTLKRDGYLRNTRRLTLSLLATGAPELFNSLPVTLQHLEIDYGLSRGIISIPKIAGLQFLELGFYLGLSRSLPLNLDHIVSKLPEFTPLIESLVLTFRIMPRIPEIPWAPHDLWPVFDVGFLERRELPQLRNVTCRFQLTMDYFHGDSSTSYGSFVTVLENKARGLTGTNILLFTQGNSSAPHLH
ncbi:hypothetical protein B0H12DRAFT_211697 [Mycena haematopus]|nr:hypothetical protein B0H12DRAFT_211697 [Mycena haematopus]